MRLASFLKNGVKFQLLRNDRSSAVVTIDGKVKKGKPNRVLATKRLKAATGRHTIVLKPSKALVGKPKRLAIRLRVVLTDAAGNRRTLLVTIVVKR